MDNIKKLKKREDGTVRVVIDLPLLLKRSLPAGDGTKDRTTVTVDIPPEVMKGMESLISIEKLIIEALNIAVDNRLKTLESDCS